MSTSLLNCEILLSKQMGDYWSGTMTSDGTATTVVDTALMAKNNDWIDSQVSEMFVMLTLLEGSASTEERRATSLDNSTGTITTLDFSAATDKDDTYRVHKLFSASDKKIALIDAAKSGSPWIFKSIRDETKVLGNWLKDGSFEIWTSATALTHWTDDGTVILAQTSTSPYYKHGSYSCKLGTAAGYIYQDITNWDDLKHLAGKSVTFTVQGYCATASTLRIAIYDGTTTTYSSYRTAESAWTEYDDPMSVTATIQDNPTAIEFHILLDTANDAYVDDARVISGTRNKVYIGDLGLAQNEPHKVSRERSDYSQAEPWIIMRGWNVGGDYLYIPSSLKDYRLRIEGMGYLDFYDTSGDVGTDWDDTIDLDSPQIEILVAEAAIYLWRTKVMPTGTTGDISEAERALAYWEVELRKRRAKFAMQTPPATIHYTGGR